MQTGGVRKIIGVQKKEPVKKGSGKKFHSARFVCQRFVAFQTKVAYSCFCLVRKKNAVAHVFGRENEA